MAGENLLGGGTGMQFLAQDPVLMRRYQMAQALQKSGTDTSPVGHPLQALARVLQGVSGSYAANKVDSELKQRQSAYGDTLAKALQAGRGSPGTTITWNQATRPDGSGGPFTEIPPVAGNTDAMIALLSGNPDTAGLGAQFQFGQLQNEQAQQRALDLLKAKNALEPPKTREVKKDGQIVTQQFDPATRAWSDVATSPQFKPDAPSSGPFEGNGMDAQALNILLQGDPSSPVYAAAYNHYSQPKVSVDPKTGQITTISPNMGGFRPPGGMGAPQSGAMGQAAPAGVPASGAGMPAQPMGAPAAPMQGDSVSVPGATVSTLPGKQPTSFTVDQSNAATFADRMQAAEAVLSKVGEQGTDFWANAKSGLPGGNYLQTPQYQMFDQAKRDFINAQLRRESGAVIAPEEFDNANKQYFPQPGDSPEVMAQKAQNRRIAINGMKRGAGPAYNAPTMQDGPAANLPALPQGGGGVKFLGFE